MIVVASPGNTKMKTLYFPPPLVLLITVTGVLGANKKAGESCATAGDLCVTPGSYCDITATKMCQCNTGFVLTGSTCARVHGQVCDVSMCSDPNMICKEGKCVCDTSAHFATGTDNDQSCGCDTTNHYIMQDNICKKKAGQSCDAAADTCVDHATCTGTPTTTCTCDTNGLFQADDSGVCVCDSSKARAKDGKCSLLNGEECRGVEDCYPADGKVCAAPSGGGQAVCGCDTTKHWTVDGTTGCTCDANYGHTAAGTCRLSPTQACENSESCVDYAVCENDGSGTTVCKCDGTKFYAATTYRCECDPSKAARKDGKCYLLNNQECSNVQECYPATGKVCAAPTAGGHAVCRCDGTKHWTASGTMSCICDTGYIRENDVCMKKVDQPCVAASDTCVNHATCTGETPTCKCDDTYEAIGGKCVQTLKKVGEACKTTADSPACVNGAICHKLTNTCMCDDANHFVATAGALCECANNFVLRGGRCLSTVGQSCVSKDTTNVCVSGAACVDNTTTTAKDFMCTCKGTVKEDGTCNGAAAVVSSLAILMVALFVTSYGM